MTSRKDADIFKNPFGRISSIKQTNMIWTQLIDHAVLLSFGVMSFCYSIFWSTFAERHVMLPFLDFPIFVGEILLFFCLVMLVLKWITTGFVFNRLYFILGIYVTWILIKAFIGYINYGPLTFRNAALFYYPLFAVISYQFFRVEYFKQKIVYGILCFFLIANLMFGVVQYFIYPYLCLSLILIRSVGNRNVRYFFYAVLLCVFPYYDFLNGSRTLMLAHALALILLMLGYVYGVMHLSIRSRVLLTFAFCLMIACLAGNFLSKEQLHSLITPVNMIKGFQVRDREVQLRKKYFHFQDLNMQLYNDNRHYHRLRTAQENLAVGRMRHRLMGVGEEQVYQLDTTVLKKIGAQRDYMQNVNYRQVGDVLVVPQEELPEYQSPQDSLTTEYSNIYFRLFIWRDMWVEMLENKAWFGFSFGHPQRSLSIEILGQALGEWSRDGWITPHNAFFHILYRAGLIGILLILIIIGGFSHLVYQFLRLKSWVGLLLASILFYWLVTSSFLVVLELPYQAIPFWCLVGVTWGYLNHVRIRKTS